MHANTGSGPLPPSVHNQNPSVGDVYPPELFPATNHDFSTISAQQIQHLAHRYNQDFGIVDKDDIVVRRAKFLHFMHWGSGDRYVVCDCRVLDDCIVHVLWSIRLRVLLYEQTSYKYSS